MQIPPTGAADSGDDTVNPPIILASGSAARRALLDNAGVAFTVSPAPVDERAIEAPLIAAGTSPAEIATALAEAKAIVMSRANPGAYVIGADQTLDWNGERWTKPATRADARAQLALLSGRSHQLHSAIVVARDGVIVWQHHDSATLTMHKLSPTRIDAYLARIGDAALMSVGVYQLEGEGIRLFERIDGDYFTILGLPLLPLLNYLRAEGAIE